MISDNYVTGDNIYLRELQNFFFEVLGMMSITHYGAIGDGRTDNYGPLQVAIDDANRRGLSYLYVPYGKFIYTGELINLIDEETGVQRITFMGNPHAKIINIRTGQEIEIHQFGIGGGGVSSYTELSNKPQINNVTLNGNKSLDDLGAQPKLTAGAGISITGNTISATGSGSAFYEVIDQDITLSADGTSSPALVNGKYYFLTPGHKIYYVEYGGDTVLTTKFTNQILYYRNSGAINKLYSVVLDDNSKNRALDYNDTGTYWYIAEYGNVLSSSGIQFTTDTIPSTGSDDKIPSVSAVRNYVGNTSGGSAIQLIVPSDVTVNSNRQLEVPLTISSNIGTAFSTTTPSGHETRVVIGDGVTNIKLSAVLTFGNTANSADDVYIHVMRTRSGTDKTIYMTSGTLIANESGQVAMPPAIIPVQSGDQFWFETHLKTSETLRGHRVFAGEETDFSWITIETIG